MLPETPQKYATRCRLCSLEFQAHPFDIRGGLLDNARLMKFFQAVSKHLQDKHPDFLSAATIVAYSTGDPSLQIVYESARAQLFQITRKNLAMDSQILERCAQVGLTQQEIDVVSPLIFEMRDYLTETGRHAPPPLST